ncbi:MAG: M14 family metallopeptidase [Planctomycetes bacterium]|nr:M14 family metallopeptidase [Planctomycetota bacterium]
MPSVLLGLLLAPQSPPPPLPPPLPQTVAESSAHAATSRAADVERFCRAAAALPHGDRLRLERRASHQDRELQLVHVALREAAPAPRLRVLVIGAIHGGEIEGKEALQQLVREFALGEHTELLRQVELCLVPIYNVDGNEAIAVGNRPGQNGPDAVGERSNGQGLDLNRDFVKAEAPETRALLALFRELDPHLFVDLHTTNGSHHGYHLTYAPSLSPNVDAQLAQVNRALLDRAQAAMRDRHGFATFDYGNFETRDRDGGGAPESGASVRGWYTYDHRARYGVNYHGLRNRLAVLAEAYSYCDFATRIAATRAFVLCLVEALAALRDDCERACAAADRRLVQRDAAVAFGFATTFAAAEPLDVLVGAVERIEPRDGRPLRLQRRGDGVPERMPVVRAFAAGRHRELPAAWAIPSPPAAVRERLDWHGVQATTLAAAQPARAQRFAVAKQRRPKRPFQGHQELVLEGDWLAAEAVDLPAGTLWIDARQPLARLAATLLEPESEDSLTTWNFFDADLGAHHPVLRVVD